MTFRAAVDKIEKRGNDSAKSTGNGGGATRRRRRWMSVAAAVAVVGGDSAGSRWGRQWRESAGVTVAKV